jgi:hypothetical protein
MSAVSEARARIEALCRRCSTPEALLAWIKANGVRASRGASSGSDSLLASLSNFLNPGTAARVERDGDLAIIGGRGDESYARLPEPAYAVEMMHQRGELPAEFYGPPIRPVKDESEWPAKAS